MSMILTTGDRLRPLTAASIRSALAEPFDPRLLKCKPGVVTEDKQRALAFTYVDARDVADRLDAVLGVGGWRDDYELLPDGNMLCRLELKIEGEWVRRCGVGSPAEQSKGGDQSKAAESDALKRAAVKFGVARYIYRLPLVWLAYDAQRRRFTERPTLPAWAAPQKRALLPGPSANGNGQAAGDGELCGEDLAREIDALIREHSKQKRWHAAIVALAIDSPPEWEEPADAADAVTSVCQWLSKKDAERLRETILRYAAAATKGGGS